MHGTKGTLVPYWYQGALGTCYAPGTKGTLVPGYPLKSAIYFIDIVNRKTMKKLTLALAIAVLTIFGVSVTTFTTTAHAGIVATGAD